MGSRFLATIAIPHGSSLLFPSDVETRTIQTQLSRLERSGATMLYDSSLLQYILLEFFSTCQLRVVVFCKSSSFPAFIHSFLPSVLPSFLLSFFPPFLLSFLPSFLLSFLLSFLISFLLSFFPSCFRSFLLCFFLFSFLPSFPSLPFPFLSLPFLSFPFLFFPFGRRRTSTANSRFNVGTGVESPFLLFFSRKICQKEFQKVFQIFITIYFCTRRGLEYSK